MAIYKDVMDAGVAGAIATTENKDMISRTVEDDAGIGFGLAVAQGVNDKGIRKVKVGDTRFVGITALDRTAGNLTINGFEKFESARVMKKGVIWVEVTEAVKAGDPAAVDLATGKFNKSGSVYPDANFETSAAAGGIAQVRLM